MRTFTKDQRSLYQISIVKTVQLKQNSFHFICIYLYQSISTKMRACHVPFWQKVLRANFTATRWKSSHVARPILDDPKKHGWYWNQQNGAYSPVMTTLIPAPESVVELSICGCKTGCKSLRCMCKKNDFVCTEMCLCKVCENVLNRTDIQMNSQKNRFHDYMIFHAICD